MGKGDAYQLQGLDGGVAVASGQTFTGLSRGLQVVNTGGFTYGLINPAGASVGVVVTSAPAGIFLRGPVSSIEVTSGLVVAFPSSTTYTIV